MSEWTGTASFSFVGYMKDHRGPLIVYALGAAAVFGMLTAFGTPLPGCWLVAGFLLILGIALFVWDFYRKKTFWTEIEQITEQLEHARHLSAFAGEPGFLEAEICYGALDALALKSSDELADAKESADAYRKYVETWIHEVKTPIAASKLILARMKGPEATALRQELESIEANVEQALYCARSETVSQDYSIRRANLAEIVREACKKRQNMLISSGAIPMMEIPEDIEVFTDASWMTFIIGQFLSNSAQYGATRIVFKATAADTLDSNGHVVLEIEDNGMGISEADAANVFKRGFIGENGRSRGSATGMGLYLCAVLCKSLGIRLELTSQDTAPSFTRITLAFPLDEQRLTER